MATALPTVGLSDASMELRFVTERHSNEFGLSKSYRDGIRNAYQTWNLTYNDISETDAETLRSFCVTNAKTGSISWTPVGQTTSLLFRLKEDPTYTYVGYNQWNVSITLEQVFDYE